MDEKLRDSHRQIDLLQLQLKQADANAAQWEGKYKSALQVNDASKQEEEKRRQDLEKQFKEQKLVLTRKFYHHAFLAVKLQLVDKNFSLPELVELAMQEQVEEQQLNAWIAKKLGLEKL